jgi:preprotein translocase subunit SecG
MLYYLVTALYVFVCVVLQMVILLQQGKGGDMASAFGGGSSQTAFGARGGATLLSKITAGFAALFMLGALSLAIIGERGDSGSLLRGTTAPPAPAPAPASPAPESGTTPAPAPATPESSTAPAPTPPATTPAAPETQKPAEAPK